MKIWIALILMSVSLPIFGQETMIYEGKELDMSFKVISETKKIIINDNYFEMDGQKEMVESNRFTIMATQNTLIPKWTIETFSREIQVMEKYHEGRDLIVVRSKEDDVIRLILVSDRKVRDTPASNSQMISKSK
jgi:hypothetical protein